MAKLDGRVAVITGGSSGIGLATARKFVEEGAYAFITGRRQAELDKAKALIGRNVTTVRGDAASLEDLDALYRVVKETKGRLDILFANAGFVEHQTIDVVARTFRQDFQHQRPRAAVRGAEGAAAHEEWRLHHPHFVDRGSEGIAGARSLRCDESRGALVRPYVDNGAEGSGHSSEHTEPGRDRYADHRWSIHVEGASRQGARFVRRRDADGPHRPSGGAGLGSSVSRVRRQQLHHRNRLAGRWRARSSLNRSGALGARRHRARPRISRRLARDRGLCGESFFDECRERARFGARTSACGKYGPEVDR